MEPWDAEAMERNSERSSTAAVAAHVLVKVRAELDADDVPDELITATFFYRWALLSEQARQLVGGPLLLLDRARLRLAGWVDRRR